MSDEFIKRRMKLADFSKTFFKTTGEFPAVSEFTKRRLDLATPETFLKRNLTGKIIDKLPGAVGKAVGAGALAGVALEKGIQKLKSKGGREAEPEIPSEVEGKAKGGLVKMRKKYQMHNGKF